MNIEFDNFVMVYDNFFTKQQCDSYIELFNRYEMLNLTADRSVWEKNAHRVKDKSLGTPEIVVSSTNISDIGVLAEFNTNFWDKAYQHYTNKYSILNEYAQHQIRFFKIQRSLPGGDGYHIWHSEDQSLLVSNRLLSFILYLNDVDDGGETEFLYLSKRISPKTGRLILFPAGYTHTHRGNPPLSNVKYIGTGWVEITGA